MTVAATPIWFSLVMYQQTQIQAMNLPLAGGGNLPSSQVYARRILTDRDTVLPAVICCPWGAEREEDGSDEDLEVTFGVVTAFVTSSNQDYTLIDTNGNMTAQNQDLVWRESIMDQFADFPVPSGAEPGLATVNVSEIRIEPFDVSDYDLWRERNLTCGSLLFNYRVNRTRKR